MLDETTKRNLMESGVAAILWAALFGTISLVSWWVGWHDFAKLSGLFALMVPVGAALITVGVVIGACSDVLVDRLMRYRTGADDDDKQTRGP